jgi:hypothetical protein
VQDSNGDANLAITGNHNDSFYNFSGAHDFIHCHVYSLIHVKYCLLYIPNI